MERQSVNGHYKLFRHQGEMTYYVAKRFGHSRFVDESIEM